MERMQDQRLKKIGSSVSSGIVRKLEKVWQGQMEIFKENDTNKT